MQNLSISLVMYGINRCSGSCVYCSAATTMGYRESNKRTFKFNKKKTKERILEYTDVENIIKNGDSASLNIDIWGGNPAENFEEFKKVSEFCLNDLKEFKEISLHTSGNGLELQSDDIVDYLIKNNIHYQLSHDGLGQWMRTGEIDPLYWDKTKNNILKLVKFGILDWINTTLNARNYSFFANMEYWNKWRRDNDLMNIPLYIKLNHIYPGTAPITKKWLGADTPAGKGLVPCKHGEEIGDLCLHGKALRDYMHEHRKFGLICLTPGIEQNLEWAPFVTYIKNQINRWQIINSENEAPSSCRKFQMGLIDKNFAIDTIGEYCQCNLIDSSTPVLNPTGARPQECETCIYSKQAECHPCGSEVMEQKCDYNFQWCQLLEEFAQLYELLDHYKDYIESQNNNCQCTGDCNCNEQKNQNAVYCVKNYNL